MLILLKPCEFHLVVSKNNHNSRVLENTLKHKGTHTHTLIYTQRLPNLPNKSIYNDSTTYPTVENYVGKVAGEIMPFREYIFLKVSTQGIH